MKGAEKLARAMDQAAARRSKLPLLSDLGTIQGNGSLLLDSFSVPIPEGDYLIDERFLYPTPILGPSGGHSQATGDGVHSHVRPDHFRPLTTGDRVLCIMLDPHTDSFTPYVIGRLP